MKLEFLESLAAGVGRESCDDRSPARNASRVRCVPSDWPWAWRERRSAALGRAAKPRTRWQFGVLASVAPAPEFGSIGTRAGHSVDLAVERTEIQRSTNLIPQKEPAS